jgi:hypothetical protein
MGLLDFNLSDVGGILTSAREAITGEKIKDPAEIAKINLQLEALDNALTTGQLKINETEASNPHVFVAGWRPFIGWVGGMAIAYQFLLYPLITWGWVASGHLLSDAPPMIDASALYPVILGMLGIRGLRTIDKIKKTDTKYLGK